MSVLATRNRGRAANPLAIGQKDVDDINDSMFNPQYDDDETENQDAPADGLSAALLKELGRGHWFSIGRAIRSFLEHGRLKDGLEKEVNDEITRRTGSSPADKTFRVPWSAPIPVERRNLTTTTGPGSITSQIPYLMMVDYLRAKTALARLGAQFVNLTANGPGGQVRIPTKSSTSTVSWVAEGNAAPASSNMSIAGLTMTPHTATAFSDVTRRMVLLGQIGFDDMVIDDIMTSLAVGVDAAGINGLGTGGQPIGLFQLPIPEIDASGDTGNGGTITYANIVAMENTVGNFNGDAPMASRMGWLTSTFGRSTLRKTDMAATGSTGRYLLESASARHE